MFHKRVLLSSPARRKFWRARLIIVIILEENVISAPLSKMGASMAVCYPQLMASGKALLRASTVPRRKKCSPPCIHPHHMLKMTLGSLIPPLDFLIFRQTNVISAETCLILMKACHLTRTFNNRRFSSANASSLNTLG